MPSEEQLVPFLTTLVCHGPGSNPWPPVPRSGHSTNWAIGVGRAKWQGFSEDIRSLSTKSCLPLPWGYTHVENIKNVYKIRIQKDVWNLQQMVEVIRAFCWHQKFVPNGFSALAQWLYACIKSFKMCLKSYFKEIVLKLATDGQSAKGFLLTSTFVPKGLSASALGLYTCIKALKYIPGPGVRWAFTGPVVLWFSFPMYVLLPVRFYTLT